MYLCKILEDIVDFLNKKFRFRDSYVNDVSVLGGISQLSTLGNKINISQGKRLFIIHIYVKESLSQTA